MPSAFTHAYAAVALTGQTTAAVPPFRLAVVVAALAALPDIDVIGLRFGIPYGAPLGHRGLTHSLVFAIAAGMLAASICFRDTPLFSRRWWQLAALCFVATASHGVLDAFTDAGLGVGFFIPFDDTRYFFPWRPLATSPLSVGAFFSGRGLAILANEFVWVWMPHSGGAVLYWALRALRRT